MGRRVFVPATLCTALALLASNCGSEGDSEKPGAAGSGGASGSAGKGSGGSFAGSGGAMSKGGTTGSAGASGTGEGGGSAGDAQDGGGQGGQGLGGAGQGGLGGGAGQGGEGGVPYVPEVACTVNEDCDAACQAHGWPEGRCYGSEPYFCACLSESDAPTCEVKTTAGCPPGTHCQREHFCMPIGSAAPGEPCPNGNECPIGHICVGYGNPLPNGANTACREICDQLDPPPGCDCSGAGFCSNSGDGGEGGAGGG